MNVHARAVVRRVLAGQTYTTWLVLAMLGCSVAATEEKDSGPVPMDTIVGEGGTPCDDNNPCTEDFLKADGTCLNNPLVDAPCDDGNVCTTGDSCNVDGFCGGSGVQTCDDGSLCTVDTCAPVIGCQHAAVPDATPCDDGNKCSVEDGCKAGVCLPGWLVDCTDPDPNDCTYMACNKLTGACDVVEGHPAGHPCKDGDACTDNDQCDAKGQCKSGDAHVCQAQTPCKKAVCNPEAQEGTNPCQLSWKEPDVGCDDGDLCTDNDHCVKKNDDSPDLVCSGDKLDCSDGNPCTSDSCDEEIGCQNLPFSNGMSCPMPNNACLKNGKCQDGVCVGLEETTCVDGNVCTDDSCAPMLGCVFTANTEPCSDGSACTVGDKCAGKACSSGVPIDCTDGNDCTDDTCDLATGCVHGSVPDGTSCGVLSGWTCEAGVCQDSGLCGGTKCPALDGYDVTCNPQDHCEYANKDTTGWKKWDVWIWVPPGSTKLGSPIGEAGHEPDEEDSTQPDKMHPVIFANGYFVGKYEIVVAQYEVCKAANPGKCTPADTSDWPATQGTNTIGNGKSEHPQNGLTWQQAKGFCGWVAPGGRLPSEAEWEYAAKGPVHRKYPWGDSPEPTCSNNTAVFNEAGGVPAYGCSQGGTGKVGSKSVGVAWSGALDMSGNVWEWCEDWDHKAYTGAPADGSAWVEPTGSHRVIRGGSFITDDVHLRASGRGYSAPGDRDAYQGARCVRPLPADCIPNCAGKQCGEDGCGGICGECVGQDSCQDGSCVEPDGLPCDDGNPNTTSDSLLKGLCTGGMVPIPSTGPTDFFIDATEVTQAQYDLFLESLPELWDAPPGCEWNQGLVPSGPFEPTALAGYPVQGIDWCDAKMFCEWAGKRLCGGTYVGFEKLEETYGNWTVSEWYRACSNDGANVFPYGSSFEANSCNTNVNQATAVVPVASMPACVGGFPGVLDMSGNVQEWTDECNDTYCLVRGGDYTYQGGMWPDRVKCVSVKGYGPLLPASTHISLGIRCCKDPQPNDCTPECGAKACGNDGCGGNCGTCPVGQSCSVGHCFFPVAPTGQVLCYDNSKQIPCPGTAGSPECGTIPFCGQDAQYDDGKKPIIDEAPGALKGTAFDTATGLTWTTKVAPQAGFVQVNGDCSNLGKSAFGGHKDWRVPSFQAAISVLPYGTSPERQFPFAPGTKNYPNFWADYWIAGVYYDGSFSNQGQGESSGRCVSGSGYAVPGENPGSFEWEVVAGPGEYSLHLHKDTGLVWSGAADLSGDWASALSHCETLDYGGRQDWRLPNVKEMASPLEITTNGIFFSKLPIQKGWYWTSTTNSVDPEKAWVVHLDDAPAISGGLAAAKTLKNRLAKCVAGPDVDL